MSKDRNKNSRNKNSNSSKGRKVNSTKVEETKISSAPECRLKSKLDALPATEVTSVEPTPDTTPAEPTLDIHLVAGVELEGIEDTFSPPPAIADDELGDPQLETNLLDLNELKSGSELFDFQEEMAGALKDLSQVVADLSEVSNLQGDDLDKYELAATGCLLQLNSLRNECSDRFLGAFVGESELDEYEHAVEAVIIRIGVSKIERELLRYFDELLCDFNAFFVEERGVSPMVGIGLCNTEYTVVNEIIGRLDYSVNIIKQTPNKDRKWFKSLKSFRGTISTFSGYAEMVELDLQGSTVSGDDHKKARSLALLKLNTVIDALAPYIKELDELIKGSDLSFSKYEDNEGMEGELICATFSHKNPASCGGDAYGKAGDHEIGRACPPRLASSSQELTISLTEELNGQVLKDLSISIFDKGLMLSCGDSKTLISVEQLKELGLGGAVKGIKIK